MKILSTFFLFLVIILFSNKGNSQTYWGGEIYYDHIVQDSFMVTVVVFRDCNSSGSIHTQAMLSSGCGSSIIPLTISQGVDVTGNCPGSISKCANPNSSFPHGIQRFELSGYFTADTNCCNYTLSWSHCCRDTGIATGGSGTNLHLEASFNRCLSSPNNSPRFTHAPAFLSCTNECFIFQAGAVDTDTGSNNMPSDSLVYSLIPAYTAQGVSIMYESQYTYDKPLHFNGFPNPNLPFNFPQCRGFHLDNSSGMLLFKPMQTQSAIIVIKVEEFRGGVKIGETMREMKLTFGNCPQPDPIIISVPGTTYQACPGDIIELHIPAYTLTGNDSIYLNANTPPPPGMNFTVTYPNNSIQPVGTIYWIPTQADVSPIPYYLTFTAKSNACPLPAVSVAASRIQVNAKPSAIYTDSILSCGARKFIASPSPASATVSWKIENQIYTQGEIIHQFSQAGVYPYELSVTENGCTTIYKDTITVNYYPLIFSLGNDTTVCIGNTFQMQPNIISGNGNYQYSWLNTSDTTAQITVTANNVNTEYVLKITDSEGCTAHDTVGIFVHPLPQQKCAIAPLDICIDTTVVDLASLCPEASGWSGQGVAANSFSPAQAGLGSYTIHMNYTDTNGCTFPDSFLIQVKGFPVVQTEPDFDICIAGATKSLSAFPVGGIWNGTGINGNEFSPSQAGTGSFHLIYTYTDVCTLSDTVVATVHPMPVADAGNDTALCENSAELALVGFPPGGNWSGQGVTNNVFQPAAAGKGIFDLIYTITTFPSCTDSSIRKIEVKSVPSLLPEYVITPNTAIVSFKLGGSVSLFDHYWNFGDGTISTLAEPVHDYKIFDSIFKAWVTAENDQSCSDTAFFDVLIPVYTGLDKKVVTGTFRIIPNPVKDLLIAHIDLPANETINISITDGTGKVLARENSRVVSGTIMIDTGLLPAGAYVISGITNNGKTFIGKFLKN